MTDRCFVMLKPMRAGLSGYARLQTEHGGAYAFISARGIRSRCACAYWYHGGGEVCALGGAPVNARGELALDARLPSVSSAPDRLQALLIIGDADGCAPEPLLIGLCARQSAGSLMDAKNAMLALCDRLRREAAERAAAALEAERAARADEAPRVSDIRELPMLSTDEADEADEAPEAPPAAASEESEAPQESDICEPPIQSTVEAYEAPETPEAPPDKSPLRALARAIRLRPRASSPPREIFLTAIDPLPYVTADEREKAKAAEPQKPKPARVRTGVDALPALRYPDGFSPLRAYFDSRPPDNPLGMKGWRFVRAEESGALLIGRYVTDARVARVAYAVRGERPPDEKKPYRAVRGADGNVYQVLVQRL